MSAAIQNRSSLILTGIAIHHIVLSLLVVLLPNVLRQVFHFPISSNYLLNYNLSIVYMSLGVGYLISSSKPYQYWIFPAIGFFINLLLFILAIVLYITQKTGDQFLILMAINAGIFALLLFYVLQQAYEKAYSKDNELIELFSNDTFTLNDFLTNEGESLAHICENHTVLLVFLRHFGCIFCKETLKDLSKIKNKLLLKDIPIVLVHMEDEEAAENTLAKYDMRDVAHISDPESILYKKFKLKRGRFFQLFGFNVLMRSLYLKFYYNIATEGISGDPYQMPGFFLLQKKQVVKSYIHANIADKPDYDNFLGSL
ncbi:MAG: SelL-related redox protein [Chitinophagales bacterium]|nr:redoxin domain-containing protein [Bacteroidota bacterium]MCB9043795.1 redoxin domain-containing protein [Chitinophagales bacterium]